MEVPETPRCPAAATEQVAAATAETRGSDRARAEAATKAVGDEEVSGGDDGGGDRDGGGGEDALPFDGAGGGGDGGGGDEAVPSGGDAAWARWRWRRRRVRHEQASEHLRRGVAQVTDHHDIRLPISAARS